MAFGEDAFAPTGELVKYKETPLGKEYMLWRERARHAESSTDVRRDIYNHLHAFFRRYYQDGDFVPSDATRGNTLTSSPTTARRSTSTGPTATSTT